MTRFSSLVKADVAEASSILLASSFALRSDRPLIDAATTRGCSEILDKSPSHHAIIWSASLGPMPFTEQRTNLRLSSLSVGTFGIANWTTN